MIEQYNLYVCEICDKLFAEIRCPALNQCPPHGYVAGVPFTFKACKPCAKERDAYYAEQEREAKVAAKAQ